MTTETIVERERRYVVPADLWPTPITRTMDATHLEAVANDPSVRPWLGGEGPVVLGDALANPLNVAFETPHGGFVLFYLGEGRYDVHSLFLPDGRGAEAFAAMRAAQDFMFSATNGVEGLTKVATTNPAAAALALRAGFERRFTGVVRWSPTEWAPHEFYGLTLERWALRSPVTAGLGRWFHDALAQAKQAAQSTSPDHPEDPAHDHMVGAAILMLRAGNALKAEQHYNRWAVFAGYTALRVLTEHPLVVDIDDAVLGVHTDAMEVLLCR